MKSVKFLHSFWGRGALVLCVSACIGALLALRRWDCCWDAQLVYSCVSGLSIWLLIEVLRTSLRTPDTVILPRGWRSYAGVVVCIGLGWAAGTFAGDAYGGKSTWELAYLQPAMFIEFVFVAALATVGVLIWSSAQVRQSQLRTDLVTSRAQAAEVQLRLLRSQLEPHMLFNTLANLRALIETRPNEALVMLDHFNAWLRSSLQASRADGARHTVADEFARLGDYVALMAVRMGPRLQVHWQAAPNAAACLLPPLLLQPLVENAIAHGLEPSATGGELWVRAQVQGAQLVLQVRNSGVGLAADHTQGYGLTHVRERLQHQFANAAQLQLGSDAQTTLAEVRMPAVTAPIQTQRLQNGTR